jgi:hypothetical protein
LRRRGSAAGERARARAQHKRSPSAEPRDGSTKEGSTPTDSRMRSALGCSALGVCTPAMTPAAARRQPRANVCQYLRRATRVERQAQITDRGVRPTAEHRGQSESCRAAAAAAAATTASRRNRSEAFPAMQRADPRLERTRERPREDSHAPQTGPRAVLSICSTAAAVLQRLTSGSGRAHGQRASARSWSNVPRPAHREPRAKETTTTDRQVVSVAGGDRMRKRLSRKARGGSGGWRERESTLDFWADVSKFTLIWKSFGTV